MMICPKFGLAICTSRVSTKRIAPSPTNIIVTDEMAFEAVHRGFRGGNRRVLRQREVHDEFTPGRWREELLLDELHSIK